MTVDDLLRLAGVSAALLLVLTIGLLLWFSLRSPRSRPAGPDRRRWVVAGAALLVLGLDAPLMVLAPRPGPGSRPDALRVQINARQWAWDVRYAGPDGEFATPDDIVTLDDLRLPAGTPVILQLAASDVVHSFFIPAYRIKRDAIPGRLNHLSFTTGAPGRHEVVCSEHCGLGHTRMGGALTVLPPAEFDAWAARASALSALDPAPGGWPW